MFGTCFTVSRLNPLIKVYFLLVVCLTPTSFCYAKLWDAYRDWNQAEEIRFSKWVAKLGERSWDNSNEMLKTPEYNSLYQASDETIDFKADCGDFPFLLRTYFAYKRNLPLLLPVVGGGNYSRTSNVTQTLISESSFQGNIKDLFAKIPDWVETGTLRTAPHEPNSATYPIAISRSTVRPGTIYYDPNGHAAIVCHVNESGNVYFLDAHPDQSVTRTRFGEKFGWNTSFQAGGFRLYRPVKKTLGGWRFVNRVEKLPHFSTEQFFFGEDYHLRVQLRLTNQLINPIEELRRYIYEDTYKEVKDRVAAVERGWAIAKKNPIEISENIYYAQGPWEDYSTPSRDIRLRTSFLNIPKKSRAFIRLAELEPYSFVAFGRDAAVLKNALALMQSRAFAELTIHYRNSDDKLVELALSDIEKRLFLLSFNPNHPPELRWGAADWINKARLSYHPRHWTSYQQEQLWRNRMIKKTGRMHLSDSDNPLTLPRHDISNQMRNL